MPSGPHAGSSPRVRGTLERLDAVGPARRFIPARAGNTQRVPGQRTSKTVHPRACGEHRRPALFGALHLGSSPRVRGTPNDVGHWTHNQRFIPARAGNTRGGLAPCADKPVHPRACGEHHPIFGSAVVACGSSPRVRGTPESARYILGGIRFIPARAGNTNSDDTERILTSVHPRACGEHGSKLTNSIVITGSSPRVRGTQFETEFMAYMVRFIPARAGNTPKCKGKP